MGRRKRRLLDKTYRIFTTFAGYRELHKNYIVRITQMFRSRALHAAGILRQSGRLAEIDDVFNLTIDEIDAALSDPSWNLRPLTVRNTAYRQQLRFVRDFPRIIDSRGKILRASPQAGAPRRNARPADLPRRRARQGQGPRGAR